MPPPLPHTAFQTIVYSSLADLDLEINFVQQLQMKGTCFCSNLAMLDFFFFTFFTCGFENLLTFASLVLGKDSETLGNRDYSKMLYLNCSFLQSYGVAWNLSMSFINLD